MIDFVGMILWHLSNLRTHSAARAVIERKLLNGALNACRRNASNTEVGLVLSVHDLHYLAFTRRMSRDKLFHALRVTCTDLSYEVLRCIQADQGVDAALCGPEAYDEIVRGAQDDFCSRVLEHDSIKWGAFVGSLLVIKARDKRTLHYCGKRGAILFTSEFATARFSNTYCAR